MALGRYCFDRFVLDANERRLTRDGTAVELNARYLDALALLVGEAGKLVSKDRFLDEVWHGVPVTDEALTQCIKTLRRQLDDDAARPRFIETVPKYGYRFIAPVEPAEGAAPPAKSNTRPARLRLAAAGTAGGATAGTLGGLLYGFIDSSQSFQSGAGSMVIVLAGVSALIGLLGGAGVAFGIAAAASPWGHLTRRSILGGTVGGLLIGGAVKLLGIDALAILFGRSPGNITGAAEGAALGAAVGLAAWLALRASAKATPERHTAAAAAIGGLGGIVIALFGGRLMAGSLDLLAHQFPESRLRLDTIGRVFGEEGFGPITRMATSALEGALFAGCIVAAMLFTQRRR